MRVLQIILVLLTLAAPSVSVAIEREIGNPWPAVKSVTRTFDFTDADNAAADLTIEGNDGRPLYKLECHPGSYSDSHETAYDYSGLFDCQLRSLYSAERIDNLLTSSFIQWSEWWANRGRFLTDNLVGKCADYPEYGSVRHLRLRGMEITLAIDDVKFRQPNPGNFEANQPILQSYRFTVSVRPDPSAISAIAAAVPYTEPTYSGPKGEIPPKCEKVIREHIPGVVTANYFREASLQPPYPRVVAAKTTATFPVVEIGDGSEVRLTIVDARGKQLYTLECSGGVGAAGVGDWGILRTLVAVGNGLNLLEDSVDPFSHAYRGLITTDQLTGACRDYPEWGSVRHFKLRGFQLTLRASLSAAQGGAGDQVNLYAEVTPDPSATSPVALPSRYIDWRFLYRPNGCEQVFVDNSVLTDAKNSVGR